MAGRVQGKVVLITGAASGLGAESARCLAREGAKLFLTDLNEDGLRGVADDIAGAGGAVQTMVHNVAKEDDWLAVRDAALQAYGRVDVLVNNAGIGGGGPLLGMSLAQWRSVQEVNLDGVFLGMRHIGPEIVKAGGGSIINLSSILGKVGQAGAAAYCASKGGVCLLTKAAALELAPMKVRVNSVHPGYIETPMVMNGLQRAENGNRMRDMLVRRHALGRLGVPREIAEGIVFLASDESSFMTGAELVIDGGYTAV